MTQTNISGVHRTTTIQAYKCKNASTCIPETGEGTNNIIPHFPHITGVTQIFLLTYHNEDHLYPIYTLMLTWPCSATTPPPVWTLVLRILPGTHLPCCVLQPDPWPPVPAVAEHLPFSPFPFPLSSLSLFLYLCSSSCLLEEAVAGVEEQRWCPQLCSKHFLAEGSRIHRAETRCWSHRGTWRSPAKHVIGLAAKHKARTRCWSHTGTWRKHAKHIIGVAAKPHGNQQHENC